MLKSLVLTMAVAMAACFAQPAAQNPPVAAKQAPPAPGPPRSFHFPKYETKKLANGLTVFAIEDHREPLVSYQLNITTPGGNATEASQAALSATTPALLREGTQTRKAHR